MTRILIFGAGGIGAGYCYALLRKLRPEDVVAVCRSNFDAASKNGFLLQSTIWGQDLHYKPTIASSVEEAVSLSGGKPFDYIVVSSKVLRTGTSPVALVKPAVSRHTSVVLLQNGIAIEEEWAKSYPNTPILSGVVYFAVTQTSPAVFSHSEIELMHIGTYPKDAPAEHKEAAQVWVNLVGECGATAKLHDDIQSERWAKLMMNAPLNPICALSRSRDSQFINSGEGTSEFMRDTIIEVFEVAHAYGYNLDKSRADNVIYRMHHRAPPGVQPSMMADALASRNMEVDAVVGNVVRLAQEKGVKTPILRTIYMLIRGLDDGFTRASEPR